jgi:hypothetical protein
MALPLPSSLTNCLAAAIAPELTIINSYSLFRLAI